MNELLLKIENIAFSRENGAVILRDVNAEIHDIPDHGQVVGFLGPSGIGKTTMFEIMAGLLAPTSGSVTINSRATPVIAGEVGVVSQYYTLFDHRTVMGNLIVAGRQACMSGTQARQKAQQLLDRFGMLDQARHYPEQLSGGQKQRVAIAQQLMCSEHFLLMDEPFSGLDVIMKDRVCHLITEVADADGLNTIIVVTHDIESAVRISDTIWLMGRDRDPQTGKFLPGAKIQTSYDLVSRGLAWHPDVDKMPEFAECVREIKELFRQL